MRIIYIANVRFPTELAHGIQIAKACEAFAKAGQEIELVVPKRWTSVREPWQQYYGISKAFKVRALAVPDTVRKWGRLGFIVQIFMFGIAAARYVRAQKPDLVYGRDEHILFLALLLGAKHVVWESHDGAWNFAARFVAGRAMRLVVVTEGQRTEYISRGVPQEKIFAVPNGVDTDSFAHAEGRDAARARLGIPLDAYVAMYAGAFGGWKGTDTLFHASESLPERIRIAAIGGYEKELPHLKKTYPRVIFVGPRPYRELPDNLAAADVCILPNTGKNDVAVRFTSPLKLLAYMAAGKPIIATDLPSARELADEDAALYVPPDDVMALANAIKALAEDPEHALSLAVHAREKAATYEWNARAKRILAQLSGHTATR